MCSIFVDRVFVLFISHHGVQRTYKCFAYVAPRGWIWVRRGSVGFGDIRGSVGRYDPWGIKAAGFAITRKINHYAAVTRHLCHERFFRRVEICFWATNTLVPGWCGFAARQRALGCCLSGILFPVLFLQLSCSPSSAASFQSLQCRLRMVFALPCQCCNGCFFAGFLPFLACVQTFLGGSHVPSFLSSLGPLAIWSSSYSPASCLPSSELDL